MKKINNNNKFKGNNIYSLNYKFDSISSAGKVSGTALDLIKRYNELAKEAQSNGNYVEMEVFRQYAEHYRKIVTEINERRNQNRENQNNNDNGNANAESNDETTANNDLVETEAAEATKPEQAEESAVSETVENAEKPRKRRSFTVVDMTAKTENAAEVDAENAEKPKRRVLTRRPTKKNAEKAEEA